MDQPFSAEIASPPRLDVPVIVFGLDAQGKAHASRFTAPEAELAERSAGLMRMRVLRLISPEEAALAHGVAQGRVFARTGRSFVPFVAQSRFALLQAAPNAFTPDPPADAPEPVNRPKSRKARQVAAMVPNPAHQGAMTPDKLVEADSDPGAIRVGSLVLACEEGAPEAWWCATVVSEQDANCLELRWSGEWSHEPTFTRRRDHIAILPPALAHELP